MKNRLLLALIGVVGAVAMLALGVVIGNRYTFADVLCPAGYDLYELEDDLKTDAGIVIPKGSTIPMKSCAYMIRFPIHFRAELTAPVKHLGEASGPFQVELHGQSNRNDDEGT